MRSTRAIRDWVTNVRTTHYLLGSVVGPHPYPMMVRDFQSVIGKEARQQMLDAEGRLPDYAVACVGGGSNAMGACSTPSLVMRKYGWWEWRRRVKGSKVDITPRPWDTGDRECCTGRIRTCCKTPTDR